MDLLQDIRSKKSQVKSGILARDYLTRETKNRRITEIVRNSLKARRDCYPYVNVPRIIMKRVFLMRCLRMYSPVDEK